VAIDLDDRWMGIAGWGRFLKVWRQLSHRYRQLWIWQIYWEILRFHVEAVRIFLSLCFFRESEMSNEEHWNGGFPGPGK
jgi:hypothetical protein